MRSGLELCNADGSGIDATIWIPQINANAAFTPTSGESPESYDRDLAARFHLLGDQVKRNSDSLRDHRFWNRWPENVGEPLYQLCLVHMVGD